MREENETMKIKHEGSIAEIHAAVDAHAETFGSPHLTTVICELRKTPRGVELVPRTAELILRHETEQRNGRKVTRVWVEY